MNIEWLRGADDDLQALFSGYEALTEGLGREFIFAVDAHLEQLKQFPRLGARYELPIRRLVMSRFPCGIFYIEQNQRIIIYAILDLRSDSEQIEHRLKN